METQLATLVNELAQLLAKHGNGTQEELDAIQRAEAMLADFNAKTPNDDGSYTSPRGRLQEGPLSVGSMDISTKR